MDADDVALCDMWEMILSLPRGSRTLMLLDPATAWTDEAYLLADIYDELIAIACGLGGEKPPKPRKRPGDLTTEQERRKSASIHEKILNTDWR